MRKKHHNPKTEPRPSPIRRPQKRGAVWLAAQLGVSHQRVSQLKQDEEWRWGGGPYTSMAVKEIKPWLQGRRIDNNASFENELNADGPEAGIAKLKLSAYRTAQIRVLIERAAALKQHRELSAAGWVPLETVQADRVAQAEAIKAKLMKFPGRAAMLAGKSETQCEQVVRDWMNEVCDHFSGATGAAGEGEK